MDGWEMLSTMDISLVNILPSPTSSMVSRGHRWQSWLSWSACSASSHPSLIFLPPADHRVEDRICHHSVIEGPQQTPAHPKGPQSPQQVDAPPAEHPMMFDPSRSLLRDLCEMPCSMSRPWMITLGMWEVFLQRSITSSSVLEMLILRWINSHQSSVFNCLAELQTVPLWHASNDGRVIGEHLEMAVVTYCLHLFFNEYTALHVRSDLLQF